VQGVVNHLMAHLGYKAPSREEAFRRNAWAKDQSVNVGGFFKKMIAGGLSGFRATQSVASAHEEQRDAEIAHAEQLTKAEADWLATRIGKDGGFDVNERRLIERLRELEKELPEGLKALIDRAA
jgi:hypothetical protein